MQTISPQKPRKLRFRSCVKKIISLPKSIYVNFRCLDWRVAWRLPLLVSWRTRLTILHRGVIRFEETPRRFQVKIGFGESEAVVARRSNLCLLGGTIRFLGSADFGEGISLCNAGQMEIGDGCFFNANCTLWCSDRITLGRELLGGWNVLLRDDDGHAMLQNGKALASHAPIVLGDHCWLCANTAILKGAGLGNDCVLSYGAVLTKAWPENHQMLGGVPAKPIRQDVDWVRWQEGPSAEEKAP